MAEQRAQVAYHFKFDPAQLIPGAVRLPETITRTIAIGEEIRPEKIPSSSLNPSDRAALVAEMEKLAAQANRVARPVDELPAEPVPATGPAAAAESEEESAF